MTTYVVRVRKEPDETKFFRSMDEARSYAIVEGRDKGWNTAIYSVAASNSDALAKYQYNVGQIFIEEEFTTVGFQKPIGDATGWE